VRFTLGLLLACACASPRPPAPPPLETFSSELARAGMSVPLPPRFCDDVDDPDVACVRRGDDDAATVRAYARLLVKRRLPDAPEARADALADAWLTGDPRFAALAQEIEHDFDARRQRAPKKADAKPKAKPKPAEPSPSKPAAAAGATADKAPKKDAPATAPPAEAGAAEAAPPTLAERLVGTWAASLGGITNVYTLCADGGLSIRSEASDPMFAELAGDLPATTGRWRAVDGDTPKVILTFGGEDHELTIAALSDDALTVDWNEGETVKLERRSRSATCG
jgi:hypothetical protein